MPNKSLGQHWLTDRTVLREIVDLAEIDKSETVLEIGPGPGTLTSELLRRAKKVIAVEFDEALASKLPGQFPGKNLEVISDDFLNCDLSDLPADYKVVANVPYYITSKIIQKLLLSDNQPRRIVLLVQKEVAERLVALPGDLSVLAISAQVMSKVSLGPVVDSMMFTPSPKVDSQAVVFEPYDIPKVSKSLHKQFFRVVKAGFSEKRKKLRSSLAGGLGATKQQAENWLKLAEIDSSLRSEDLSIDQWVKLVRVIYGIK